VSAGYALLGGLLGAGVVVGIGVYMTRRQLQADVDRTVAEATGSAAARSALARDAQIVGQKLRGYAERYATDLATATANNVLGSAYGLTPERIVRLEQLAARYS
jgi:hypothetical protein